MDEKTVDQKSYDAVEDRIRDFDYDRALKLMQIIEKVTTVSPKNTAFIGLAQAELERMHNEALAIAKDRADAAKSAEAERSAEEARARRAEAAKREAEEREAREAADAKARAASDPDSRKPAAPVSKTVPNENHRRV